MLIKEKLAVKEIPSRLRILADACRKPIIREYLNANGVDSEDINWLSQTFPGKVHDLHDQCNLAEHGSVITWKCSEIGKYYNAFLRIYESGILPRLCMILLKKSKTVSGID